MCVPCVQMERSAHACKPCPCVHAPQEAAAKLKAAEGSQAALKADLAKARDELERVRG